MGVALTTSIVKPLTGKIQIFNSHLGKILTGLRNGDPAAKKEIENLWQNLSNFLQEAQSAYASVFQARQNAIATATDPKNSPGMIGMIAYYITEGIYFVGQFMPALLKLIGDLLSISSLLTYFTADLVKMQQYLNTKLLWLKRALTRTQQKIAKEIEWQKRTITENLNIAYLTAQKKQYQLILAQLQASLPPKPAPADGINGEYINGVFAYYDMPLNSVTTNALAGNATTSGTANTLKTSSTILAKVAATNSAANNTTAEELNSQITAVQNQITKLTLDLQNANDELSKFIPADKKFWANKWKEEEDRDRADLLNNFPSPGN